MIKNPILTLLFLTFTVSLSAQGVKIPKDTTTYKYKKIAEFQQDYSYPIVFIDNKIASQEGFSGIETSNIKDIQVIKSGQDFLYPNLTELGLISIQMKKPLQLPTKKITEINRFFMLDKDNPIYLNGYLIENQMLEIYVNAIKEIETVAPTQENNLQKEVLNIWTFSREEARKNPVTHSCIILSR